MIRGKRFIFLTGCLVLVFAFWSLLAFSQNDDEIRLAFVQKIHYTPTIICLKEGYFKAEGLKVKPLTLPAGTGIASA